MTLVDGRRDVPGVKFRRDEVLLVPAPERSFFLAAVGYDPFALKKEPDAVNGRSAPLGRRRRATRWTCSAS